ncbi:MAG: hypothetical protein ABJM65_02385 [Ascidiaceihabitans sp.]|uniref:hypothetical protein n=2 Tax=Ascidiaceihabitans sp. TaxID=1872644 RepID=UPI0032994AA4
MHETDVESILIPRDTFDDLISVSKDFRAFVFEAYSKRITDLFMVIEEITFKRMDIRGAQKLLELQDAQNTLHLTHQQMAVELGTARYTASSVSQSARFDPWKHRLHRLRPSQGAF